MQRTTRWAALACALAFTAAPAARADLDDGQLHWHTNFSNLGLVNCTAPFTQAGVLQATQDAYAIWEIPGTRLNMIYDGEFTAPVTNQPANAGSPANSNEVWITTSTTSNPGASSYWDGSFGIMMTPGGGWTRDNWVRVMIHEIGHNLGLGHTPAGVDSTMGSHLGPTLGLHDIAWALYLWPNDTVRPPAPVITTNGGANFTTSAPTIVLEGTAKAEAQYLAGTMNTGGVVRNFQFAIDGGMSFVDGVAPPSATATLSWSSTFPLPSGPYPPAVATTYAFYAVDHNGNKSTASDSITISNTYDVTPPVMAITAFNGALVALDPDELLTIGLHCYDGAVALSGTVSADARALHVNDGSGPIVNLPISGGTWAYADALEYLEEKIYQMWTEDASGNLSAPLSVRVRDLNDPRIPPPPAPTLTGWTFSGSTVTLNGSFVGFSTNPEDDIVFGMPRKLYVNGSPIAYTPEAGSWTFTTPQAPGTTASYGVMAENNGGRSRTVWFTITTPAISWIRGDCNGDRNITSADVIYLVNYVFKGGLPPFYWSGGQKVYEPKIGDCNASGTVNSADVIYLVNYVFKGGPAPIPYTGGF